MRASAVLRREKAVDVAQKVLERGLLFLHSGRRGDEGHWIPTLLLVF